MRLAALQTLHAVVSTLGQGAGYEVGHGDALAFFLPGLVSGLAKQLMQQGATASSSTSSSATSAAGGSGTIGSGGSGSACLVSALGCLSDAVAWTLGDDAALLTLHREEQAEQARHARNGPGLTGAAAASAAALAALKAMSLGGDGAPAAAPPPPAPAKGVGGEGQGPRGSLKVDRTPSWLSESGSRVGGLLSRVLPPLCGHPSASVRAALAAAAARLLRCCCRGSGGGAEGSGLLGTSGGRALLDIVLTLSQDEWQRVRPSPSHSLSCPHARSISLTVSPRAS